jgi:hypothetical protein
MRVIAEPARQGDLAQRLVGRQHEVLRTLDAAACDECGGSRAKGRLERPGEVTRAQPRDVGEIGQADRRGQAGVDVSANAPHLPRREAAARRHRRHALGADRVAVAFGLQQRRSSRDACDRRLPVAAQRAAGVVPTA